MYICAYLHIFQNLRLGQGVQALVGCRCTWRCLPYLLNVLPFRLDFYFRNMSYPQTTFFSVILPLLMLTRWLNLISHRLFFLWPCHRLWMEWYFSDIYNFQKHAEEEYFNLPGCITYEESMLNASVPPKRSRNNKSRARMLRWGPAQGRFGRCRRWFRPRRCFRNSAPGGHFRLVSTPYSSVEFHLESPLPSFPQLAHLWFFLQNCEIQFFLSATRAVQTWNSWLRKPRMFLFDFFFEAHACLGPKWLVHSGQRMPPAKLRSALLSFPFPPPLRLESPGPCACFQPANPAAGQAAAGHGTAAGERHRCSEPDRVRHLAWAACRFGWRQTIY